MTQKPALRTPVFVKIEDISRGRSGYNVYVKVLKTEKKQVDTRDGQKITLVDAIVADETGSVKAFFKGENAKMVKEGAVLAIRNGLKRIIKGHISLALDIFGRVTEEKVIINLPKNIKNISDEDHQTKEKKKNGQRKSNGKNRRYDIESDRKRKRSNDREYDRRENQNNRDGRPTGGYQQKGRYQENRENRRPLVKISKIEPGQENLSFIAKIISSTLVGNNLRLVLGDSTGIVNAFLRYDDLLVVGKSIIIFGAVANVVKEHIEIQRGRIEASYKSIEKVDESLNVSHKFWIPIE